MRGGDGRTRGDVSDLDREGRPSGGGRGARESATRKGAGRGQRRLYDGVAGATGRAFSSATGRTARARTHVVKLNVTKSSMSTGASHCGVNSALTPSPPTVIWRRVRLQESREDGNARCVLWPGRLGPVARAAAGEACSGVNRQAIQYGLRARASRGRGRWTSTASMRMRVTASGSTRAAPSEDTGHVAVTGPEISA